MSPAFPSSPATLHNFKFYVIFLSIDFFFLLCHSILYFAASLYLLHLSLSFLPPVCFLLMMKRLPDSSEEITREQYILSFVQWLLETDEVSGSHTGLLSFIIVVFVTLILYGWWCGFCNVSSD